MATEDIFDNVQFDDLSRIYLCDICYKPVVNAKVCAPCGHSFCGACVLRLRATAQLDRCPMCRSRIEDLVPNRLAEAILGTVNGTCLLCQHVFPLAAVEQHRSNCQNFVIQCGRCRQQFQRREEASHQDHCEMLEVHCECGAVFTRREEAMHLQHACGHTLVACPLACGNTVKRVLIATHTKTSCTAAVMQCRVSGCEERFARSGREQHDLSRRERHANYIQRENSQLLWDMREGPVAVRIRAKETTSMTWDIPADSRPPLCSPQFQKFTRQWRLFLEPGFVGVKCFQGVNPMYAKITFFIKLRNGRMQVRRGVEATRISEEYCTKIPLPGPVDAAKISVKIEEMEAVRV